LGKGEGPERRRKLSGNINQKRSVWASDGCSSKRTLWGGGKRRRDWEKTFSAGQPEKGELGLRMFGKTHGGWNIEEMRNPRPWSEGFVSALGVPTKQ